MDKDKEMSEKDNKVTESLNENQDNGTEASHKVEGRSKDEEIGTEASPNVEGVSTGDEKDTETSLKEEGAAKDEGIGSEVSPKEEVVTGDEDKGTEATSKDDDVIADDGSGSKVSPKAEGAIADEGSGIEASPKEESATTVEGRDSEVSSKEEGTTTDEENEQDENQEEDALDFNHLDKGQLLKMLKDFLKEQDFIKKDQDVQELKNHFDEFYHKEKDAALAQFIEEGGEANAFAYRGTDEDREFFAAYQLFKDRKFQQVKEIERSKEKNAQEKNQILDNLRNLVDGEETTNSIETIKKFQEDWKKIGPVPHNQNKNLWASYNALMDRFYDNRSIYFELKELDRKKNLESKTELCEKAEALAEIEDIKEAIKNLNDLHEEFKHIGPVPREEQEALWQRFKGASDAIYARRKDYYEGQKETFKANQDLKEKLILQLETYKDFKAERIRDWNTKTKEILSIQKSWEAIGPVPRESGKDINKTFWGLFKQFFHHKNQFFKELDEIRHQNKEKAEKLIADAEGYSESTDWKTTSNQLIQLQKEWKELGPMPEKFRDGLYGRFKKACDTFFDNRRNSNKEINKEFEDNLEAKEAVCQAILKASKDKEETTADRLEGFIQQYNEIGFVPRKSMKDISSKFNEVVNTYLSNLELEGQNKEDFLFRLNLNKLQADPNSAKVLNKKEHGIRKQISDLENNITLWRNNLEFFASSKTADKLKDQFEEKIDKAEEEVDRLKKKLSIIREF